MERYQLRWPEGESGWVQQGLLLVVAVETPEGTRERALPCRVVGTIAPGCPPFPQAQETAEAEPGRQIAALLGEIGVPPNLLGCACLRTALALLQEDPSLRRGMMRTLYPQVARVHGVSARSVERAIRHAIGQTWARGGAERCRRLLGRMGSTVGERPTNSEMLTMLADHLAMSRDKWPQAR